MLVPGPGIAAPRGYRGSPRGRVPPKDACHSRSLTTVPLNVMFGPLLRNCQRSFAWSRVAVSAAGVLCVLSAGRATAETPAAAGDSEAEVSVIRPEAIRADMRFLADDLLEGRRAG